MEDSKLLTAKDLMQLLQLGRNTVYELLQLGKIKSVKVGNSYRIKPKDFHEYLQSSTIQKKPH